MLRKKSHVVVGAIFTLLAVRAQSQEFERYGELQIICEEGVEIYLNEVHIGTTVAEQEGLFVDKLAPQIYRLKATKTGFVPVLKNVEIRAGILHEETISFTKRDEIVEDLEKGSSDILVRKVGVLEIRVVPPRPKATVTVDDVQRGEGNKRISNIEIGEHFIAIRRAGEEILCRVIIEENETIQVRADFRDMTTSGCQTEASDTEEVTEDIEDEMVDDYDSANDVDSDTETPSQEATAPSNGLCPQNDTEWVIFWVGGAVLLAIGIGATIAIMSSM